MKKLLAAVSLGALFITGAMFAHAQTNANCLTLTHDMGIGATDATSGGDVTKLQNFLIARGFLQVKSSADLGTYGPQTSRGVAQFQKGHGIIATGYVGPITRSNIQTITCAIGAVDTSTLATTTLSTGSLPLLTFTSPVTGALVVKGEKDITPDWVVSADVKTLFAGAVASIKTELIDSAGAVVGVLGNQVRITAKNTHKIENSFVRILKGKGGREDNSMDPGQYRLRATLVYGGADAALVTAAARYSAESGWFTVVNPAPQPNIKFSVSPEFLTAAGTTSLTWSSATGSVCSLFNGAATTSVASSGAQIVNVTQSTSYRIECSLTSAWPFAGNSYTTTEKRDREVQIITGAVSATIASAIVSGSPKVLTFTGSTNAPELGFRIVNSAGAAVYTSDSVTIRNGQYTKTVSASLFGGANGQYTIQLYGPTALTGSAVLASKTFTISSTTTCASGQTWNGTSCVTTPTCNSEQTSIAGVCVDNTKSYTCTNGTVVHVPMLVVVDSSNESLYCSGSTSTTSIRNFVASTQSSCNSLVTSAYGSLVKACAVGGGCTINGQLPTTSNPSANPTLWGACVAASSVPATTITAPSTLYNFVASTKASCESSIATRSLTGTCSIGGGCSLTGGMPSSTNPSANPTLWGACIDSSNTATTSDPLGSAPSITLSPDATVAYGATTTITWSATGSVGTCLVAGGNLTTGMSVASSGSWTTPALYTTTQYGIYCKNSAGLGSTKYVKITVPKQTSEASLKINLSASNGTIDAGKTTTIKWSVIPSEGVTCVAAGGDLAAGATIGTTGLWATPALYTTTQYGIKCTDASGNSSYKYVKVNVRALRSSSIPSNSAVLGVSTSNECVDLPYNFHRGSESNSVMSLQKFLIARGFLNDGPTGFYGDKTVSAVKAYQESEGLPQTGMVYDFTRAAIAADSCQ